MRKFIFSFLIAGILIILIFIGMFSLYKYYTLKKINQKDQEITLLWSQFYDENTERLKTIDSLITHSTMNCETDSLKAKITNNKLIRKANNVDELWVLEYETNQELLKIAGCLNNERDNIENTLKFNTEKLNKILSIYNMQVQIFNEHISTFPNFFLTKKKRYKKKSFFILEYGKDNKSYYEEKKQAENWIETGKWE